MPGSSTGNLKSTTFKVNIQLIEDIILANVGKESRRLV
jgi:hypothetical protein